MASLKSLCVVVLLASLPSTTVGAQTLSTSTMDPHAPPARIHLPAHLPELRPASAAATNDRTAGRQTTAKPKRKRRVMGFAIVAGIGAAVAGAALAASEYSRNEGTSCDRCFVEWSAIAAPAGAGIGALIGYLIDRSRD
jgi:hypothetical protein